MRGILYTGKEQIGYNILVSIFLMLFGETVKRHLELIILIATVFIILFCVIVYKKIKGKNNGNC